MSLSAVDDILQVSNVLDTALLAGEALFSTQRELNGIIQDAVSEQRRLTPEEWDKVRKAVQESADQLDRAIAERRS